MTAIMFETPVEEWFDGEYAEIPERMREGLRRYIIDRIQPGDFLTAVICNDLRNAVGHADAENLSLIPLYVRWFYNVAPHLSHGSLSKMHTWLDRS